MRKKREIILVICAGLLVFGFTVFVQDRNLGAGVQSFSPFYLVSTSTQRGLGTTTSAVLRSTDWWLGVGTTSPSAPLSVAGEAFIDFLTSTSTTATSTIAGGLNITGGGIKIALPSCNGTSVLETDAGGAIVCGEDASGGGGAGNPNVTYTQLGATKYYTASSTATDNKIWYFANGFISNASSTQKGIFKLSNFITGSSTATSTLAGGLKLDSVKLLHSANCTSELETDASGAIFCGTSSAGAPGGNDTEIQFNDSSAFGGDSDLTWNKTTNRLTLLNGGNIIAHGSSTFSGILNLKGKTYASSTILMGNGFISNASSTHKGILNIASFITGSSTATSTLTGGLRVGSGGLTSTKGLTVTGGVARLENGAVITCTGCITDVNVADIALGGGTSGNYLRTLADDGQSTITVTGSGAEDADVTLRVVDVVCTDCLGTTEIADSYLLNTGDTSTGLLTVSAGGFNAHGSSTFSDFLRITGKTFASSTIFAGNGWISNASSTQKGILQLGSFFTGSSTATSTLAGGLRVASGGLASSKGLTITGGAINFAGDSITDFVGTGLQVTSGALTLNATGDWTGTFDGQQGTWYIDRANHTGTQLASTITAATFGAGNFIFPTDLLVTQSLNATSTLHVTGLTHLDGGLISNAASSTFTGFIRLNDLFASSTVRISGTGTSTVTAGDFRITAGLFRAAKGIFDTFLQIPGGTNPTVDDAREIALDTTDAQLKLATSTLSGEFVAARAVKRIYSFRVSSSSAPFYSGFASGLKVGLPAEIDGFEAYHVMCNVWGGTSVDINLTDTGANDTNTVTCGSATSTVYRLTTNTVFTAGEGTSIEFGTISGVPDYLSISIFGVITPE